MRNTTNIWLSVCIGLSLFLAACNTEKDVNYAIVSGTLENATGSEVSITSLFTSISLDTVPQISYSVNPDESGAFIDTLFIDSPRRFSLIKDKDYVGFTIEPGDHLEIIADCNDLKQSVAFSGDGADRNTYLLEKEKIHERINMEYRESRNDDEATFRTKQDGYKNDYSVLLDSFEGLPEKFIADEKKEIQYDIVKSYIYYAMRYKDNFGEDAPELSSDFMDILSTVNFNDYSEFKRSISYQFLLKGYFDYKFSKAVDNTWEADPLIKLKIIAESVSDNKLLDELFIMSGKNDITRSHNLQEYYDFFIEKVSNRRYKDLVSGVYEDLMRTQPGKTSPEFTNYESIHGGKSSLKDFRGKYIYIDVWATWCGPCKGELPFLKEIEEKYHNRNIEFVSISIDAYMDVEKWRSFVKKEGLKGVQLIADNDWNSEFVQRYQIKGIPHFILIDPDGIIVRPDAPRPSDKNLIDLFDELGI